MAYEVTMLRTIFGLQNLEQDGENFIIRCIVICISQLILLCCSNQGKHEWQKYIHTKLLLKKPATHFREKDTEGTEIFPCVI
jgi:hypothetical protein